ncbi:MAG: hypothetical protein Q8P25_00020 [Candidatus Curtissbacteria bacterium]|nr:hypothetical protein [Candidatus Curtissbacteria bacterium]
MEEQNLKKAKEYSNAALFSSILLVVFGFGFGFVNMAFFLIAIATSIFGLVRNKAGIKSVKIKCISAIVIVLVTVVLTFVGFTGLIDIFV